MDTVTTISPDMEARIVAVETELAKEIDSMPFDFAEHDFRRWRSRTDRHDRWTVGRAEHTSIAMEVGLGGVAIVLGLYALIMSGRTGDDFQREALMLGLGLGGILFGFLLILAGSVGRKQRIVFYLDPKDHTLVLAEPVLTRSRKPMGHTISADQIAAVQLCGALNQVMWVRQLNLVLHDSAGDRVRLLSVTYESPALIVIAKELADAIGKPLIVHEPINMVETVAYTLGQGLTLRGNGGQRKKKRDLSHLPPEARLEAEPTKTSDVLGAFDDKLKPDDEPDA